MMTLLVLTVVVNPKATAEISAPDTICQGDEVDLFSQTSTNDGSYYWYFAGAAYPYTSRDANPSGIVWQNISNTYIDLTYTDLNGCQAKTRKNLSVLRSPYMGISAPTQACVGDLKRFIGHNSYTGSQYYFEFGADAQPLTSNDRITNDVSWTSQGLKDILYRVTDATGCSSELNRQVQVDAVPVANITLSPSIVCFGSTADFAADDIPNVTYDWDFGDNASPSSFSGSSISGVTWTTPGIKNISVTVTSSAGCSSTATTTVDVQNVPAAGITSSPFSFLFRSRWE